MSIAISGTFVMVVFLLVSMLTYEAILGTTATQGTSLQEASEARLAQVGATISIASTSAADSGDGTNVTVLIDNSGAISYGQIADMDVLTKYTNSTGDLEIKRLDYVCKQLCGDSTDPAANQWTVSSISPDSYNPKMWDPDERATVFLRLSPLVKASTSGTVVVAVPGGVSDSAYFTN